MFKQKKNLSKHNKKLSKKELKKRIGWQTKKRRRRQQRKKRRRRARRMRRMKMLSRMRMMMARRRRVRLSTIYFMIKGRSRGLTRSKRKMLFGIYLMRRYRLKTNSCSSMRSQSKS